MSDELIRLSATEPDRLGGAGAGGAVSAVRFVLRGVGCAGDAGAPTPALDVMLRARDTIDGAKLTNYIAGGTLTSAITLSSCPAVSVPCGFGRPAGLQIVAPARMEARALAAAGLFERSTGLDRLLPIAPRGGTVPADAG